MDKMKGDGERSGNKRERNQVRETFIGEEDKLKGKNYIFKIAFFNKTTENNYKMIISSCSNV